MCALLSIYNTVLCGAPINEQASSHPSKPENSANYCRKLGNDATTTASTTQVWSRAVQINGYEIRVTTFLTSPLGAV